MYLINFLLFFVLLPTLFLGQESATPKGSPGETPGNSAASVFAPAQTLVRQARYEEAISQLQSLAAKQPPPRGLAHELGFVYYKKGDYPKAVDSLKQAVAEDPGDNEGTQLLGLSYYLSGRPAEAIPFLEKVQTWYPRANIDASYILGVCYIQSKNYPQAQKAFAKMFNTAPDSAGSYLFTARMLLRQEYEPVAEEYAQRAISLDPKLPLAHYLLGELYLFKSQVPESIAEFEKELAINPAYPAAYYKLADAYSRVQKFDDAERLLQQSIWLDATATGPYILLGKVLEKKGETELAIRALQHALSMDPNNPIPHHLLGQAYRDAGRAQDAEQELQTAKRLQDSQKP
jgi:tetratricopeptide (TPR) repeat protein